ncbi:hypothetical protein FF38_00307 [Lucilia cuprina]|uniref:Uncharacterized protein n=1 Tax=Lucilia cuprina TaxID=7375 RepID=A0A0L0BLC6_LUCCU|nr:hypothetical protein FF38_00307 [Lucilia cuprina]
MGSCKGVNVSNIELVGSVNWRIRNIGMARILSTQQFHKDLMHPKNTWCLYYKLYSALENLSFCANNANTFIFTTTVREKVFLGCDNLQVNYNSSHYTLANAATLTVAMLTTSFKIIIIAGVVDIADAVAAAVYNFETQNVLDGTALISFWIYKYLYLLSQYCSEYAQMGAGV